VERAREIYSHMPTKLLPRYSVEVRKLTYSCIVDKCIYCAKGAYCCLDDADMKTQKLSRNHAGD
jgi:hypothetical protein